MANGIDMMTLYSEGDTAKWNRRLKYYHRNKDINGLCSLRRELQIGMSEYSKKFKVNQEMQTFFIRLNRSLEQTCKLILREKHPNPCDNRYLNTDIDPNWISVKRKRDQELEAFYKKSSY